MQQIQRKWVPTGEYSLLNILISIIEDKYGHIDSAHRLASTINKNFHTHYTHEDIIKHDIIVREEEDKHLIMQHMGYA